MLHDHLHGTNATLIKSPVQLQVILAGHFRSKRRNAFHSPPAPRSVAIRKMSAGQKEIFSWKMGGARYSHVEPTERNVEKRVQGAKRQRVRKQAIHVCI